MKLSYLSILLFIFFCFTHISVKAQDYVIIDSVGVIGNTISKEKIILRNLDVEVGDTIFLNRLTNVMEFNIKLLLSSGMVNDVKYNFKSWVNNHAHLIFAVTESRVILPVPSIELADRNFNVWWKDYNFSFRRINFELGLFQSNLTGYNDRLATTVQIGYTRKVAVEYTRPYLFKKKNIGYSIGVLYAGNKEIGYNTVLNKVLFYRDDKDILLKRFRIQGALLYRHKIKHRHNLKLSFFHNKIEEKVKQDYNPTFFKGGSTEQKYLSLKYTYSHSTTDLVYYPKKGSFFKFEVQKEGLGLFGKRNFFNLAAEYTKYFSYTDRWSSRHKIRIKRELNPHYEDYFTYKSLGYKDDEIRGYEVSVINGLHYYYSQSALRFKVLDFVYNWDKFMSIKSFKIMPLEADLTIFGDIGYVEDPYNFEKNDFTNRLLFGKGVGIDILLYNKYIFQIQYSFNHQLKSGLYFHYKFNFR